MQSPMKRAETTGQLIGVRIQPETVHLLDAYRGRQRHLPTRPGAIRRLVNRALTLEEAMDLLDARRRSGIQPSRYRALIIEPENLDLATMKILCEAAGIEVAATARTAEEAVAAAELRRHNLILSETRIGEADGLELVTNLLGFSPAAVIFITHYPDVFLTGARPERAFLLAKPIHARPFLDLLSRLTADDNFAQFIAGPYSGEMAEPSIRRKSGT